MSNFRRIASGMGIVVTIIGLYKAQGVVVQYMKENEFSSEDINSGRVATIFVMSIIIGGFIDKTISYAFGEDI